MLFSVTNQVTFQTGNDTEYTIPRRSCNFTGCQLPTENPCHNQDEELKSSFWCSDRESHHDGTVNYLCCVNEKKPEDYGNSTLT